MASLFAALAVGSEALLPCTFFKAISLVESGQFAFDQTRTFRPSRFAGRSIQAGEQKSWPGREDSNLRPTA